MNTINSVVIEISILLILVKESFQGPHEKRLLHHLLDHYNTLERPAANESEPLQISLGMTLMQIIDVDEKNQLLITNMWLKLEWSDYNLRWNTSEFGNVKDIRIPPHRIWKPDVLMYNSADEGFDSTFPTNVVVRNNGSCFYLPPGIFKSTCKIDITWFPFDDQKCDMKFGSWTYNGFMLDLQLNADEGDTSSFVTNGEWSLLGVPAKRNVIYYTCCPEPYVDVTFTIIIRRRTLYYFFNLIVPCVLIASMAVLGFTLPPDSGEKLSLGVTILLSLTVFSLMLCEVLPEISDAIPLLGTYFNCIMFMVASSVVSTVIILNYHHRCADTHEMTPWLRSVFLTWLPWILRMQRPADKVKNKNLFLNSKMKELEMKERSSKSLLANVLDIDDDFRQHTVTATTTIASGMGSFNRISSTPAPPHEDSTLFYNACFGSHRELSLILKELRFITEKMNEDKEEDEIKKDWKYAAMIVDRLCLIIFTLFTIIATVAVLFSAPHIIVP
ncbi:neuronal acetylcholine receptor subunit alpha-7-like isoform X4 [Artemia franciscana]|uniref:neuronal acetylcholine receptor subunit alpha-7-like isoform X4 n=1 Tax=Artemia franciscana TaxID=6661 RepID=UPI0032DAAB0A